MSDVRQGSVPLTIGGRTYDIVLSFNVIDLLQERYGDISSVSEKFDDKKEFAWIVSLFINDAVDNHNEDYPNDKKERVTEKWVLLKMTAWDRDIVNAIMKAFKFSIPESDIEDDADPNAQTTEQ